MANAASSKTITPVSESARNARNIRLVVHPSHREAFLSTTRNLLAQDDNDGDFALIVWGEDPEKSNSFYMHLQERSNHASPMNSFTDYSRQVEPFLQEDIEVDTFLVPAPQGESIRSARHLPVESSIEPMEFSHAHSNTCPIPAVQSKGAPSPSHICLNVELSILPAFRQAFLTMIEENARLTNLVEVGCIHYLFGESTFQENTFHVYQEYQDDQALQTHRQAPYYSTWTDFANQDAFAKPLKVHVYHKFNK